MRAAPTWSERLLWSRLSGSQLGVAFRRQVVIAGARRDRELARLGWRVLRVPASVVERALEVAVEAVIAALEAASRT
ncbi:MAG TPA: hypothetical protein VIF09_13445 [Polyangiaceae bacterium]